MPPISWWTTLGGVFLLGVFGGMLTLSCLVKYKVTVKAPANIRPVGELRLVQAAREGVIKNILVKGNQEVKQGDVMAYLDDTQLQTQKSQRQGTIQQNQLQLIQIKAQITALDHQIKAETNQFKGTIAAAEAQVNLNQRNYQDKRIISQAEVAETEASLELARDELRRYQQLANTGAISQLQLKEKEAAVKTAQARLVRAKTSLDPSVAEIAIAQENIVQETARGKANLASLNREKEALIQRQVEIANQINSDTKEIEKIDTELKNTFIRASAAGRITQLNLRNNAQVVNAGDIIARIAPSEAPLEIKAQVASVDIDQVKPGQQVQMRVSACPYPDYGTLKGTVKSISPDTTKTEGENFQPRNTNYDVTIEPASLKLNFQGKECQLKTGMEGRADLISSEETIFQFILRKTRLITDL